MSDYFEFIDIFNLLFINKKFYFLFSSSQPNKKILEEKAVAHEVFCEEKAFDFRPRRVQQLLNLLSTQIKQLETVKIVSLAFNFMKGTAFKTILTPKHKMRLMDSMWRRILSGKQTFHGVIQEIRMLETQPEITEPVRSLPLLKYLIQRCPQLAWMGDAYANCLDRTLLQHIFNEQHFTNLSFQLWKSQRNKLGGGEKSILQWLKGYNLVYEVGESHFDCDPAKEPCSILSFYFEETSFQKWRQNLSCMLSTWLGSHAFKCITISLLNQIKMRGQYDDNLWAIIIRRLVILLTDMRDVTFWSNWQFQLRKEEYIQLLRYIRVNGRYTDLEWREMLMTVLKKHSNIYLLELLLTPKGLIEPQYKDFIISPFAFVYGSMGHIKPFYLLCGLDISYITTRLVLSDCNIRSAELRDYLREYTWLLSSEGVCIEARPLVRAAETIGLPIYKLDMIHRVGDCTSEFWRSLLSESARINQGGNETLLYIAIETILKGHHCHRHHSGLDGFFRDVSNFFDTFYMLGEYHAHCKQWVELLFIPIMGCNNGETPFYNLISGVSRYPSLTKEVFYELFLLCDLLFTQCNFEKESLRLAINYPMLKEARSSDANKSLLYAALQYRHYDFFLFLIAKADYSRNELLAIVTSPACGKNADMLPYFLKKCAEEVIRDWITFPRDYRDNECLQKMGAFFYSYMKKIAPEYLSVEENSQIQRGIYASPGLTLLSPPLPLPSTSSSQRHDRLSM
jgi:hypothetical protein